jgi:hypothetical protein
MEWRWSADVGHDMDRSGAPKKQANCVRNRERRWNGDGLQMSADDLR